mmetsp:Transcript_29850/g.29010  ORF Transcript_29850/g.29010 Transcript_29850/m.29010 type:complete len:116 (-) Transcript_29850:548-895(-)
MPDTATSSSSRRPRPRPSAPPSSSSAPSSSKKKGMFEPYVRAQKDYKNILMLSYYRNGLSHIFVNEAFIALTLLALGETVCMEEGVTLTRVQNHAYFIADLLSNEFVVKQKLNSE